MCVCVCVCVGVRVGAWVHRYALSLVRARNVHRMRQDEDANAEAAAGDLDKAEALYDRAAQLAPDDPDVLYQVIVFRRTCGCIRDLLDLSCLLHSRCSIFGTFAALFSALPAEAGSVAREAPGVVCLASLYFRRSCLCVSLIALFSSHARPRVSCTCRAIDSPRPRQRVEVSPTP